MSDRRRYRKPLEIEPEPDATPDHSHEQPRGLILLVKVLTTVVILLLITMGWLLFTVYRLQQGQSETTAFIEGRGQERDEQNRELGERINQATCDVLDQLPAGELLDPVRAQYGCGPGIPVAELDPAALENLAEILAENDAQTVPAPAETDEPAGPTSEPGDLPPGAPPGARPFPNGQAPTTSAPSSTAEAPTTTAAPTTAAPTPLADLSGVTDRVCEALGVCL